MFFTTLFKKISQWWRKDSIENEDLHQNLLSDEIKEIDIAPPSINSIKEVCIALEKAKNSKGSSGGLTCALSLDVAIVPVNTKNGKTDSFEAGALIKALLERRANPLSGELFTIDTQFIMDEQLIKDRNNELAKYNFTEDDFLNYRKISRASYQAWRNFVRNNGITHYIFGNKIIEDIYKKHWFIFLTFFIKLGSVATATHFLLQNLLSDRWNIAILGYADQATYIHYNTTVRDDDFYFDNKFLDLVYKPNCVPPSNDAAILTWEAISLAKIFNVELGFDRQFYIAHLSSQLMIDYNKAFETTSQAYGIATLVGLMLYKIDLLNNTPWQRALLRSITWSMILQLALLALIMVLSFVDIDNFKDNANYLAIAAACNYFSVKSLYDNTELTFTNGLNEPNYNPETNKLMLFLMGAGTSVGAAAAAILLEWLIVKLTVKIKYSHLMLNNLSPPTDLNYYGSYDQEGLPSESASRRPSV